MNWFKRRRAPDPVTVQLRDGEYHPFGILGSCVPSVSYTHLTLPRPGFTGRCGRLCRWWMQPFTS